MRSEWEPKALRDCGKWLSGGTPSTSQATYWGGDIPWISAASLHDFRISDSERRLTAEGAANGTRLVGPGTVIFIVRGMSLKTEFRIGITQREVGFGQDCKAIIPHPDVDSLFLAYAMKGRDDEILGLVDEAGHGTGRLQTDLLEKLEILVPSIAEQRRVTAVLTALDDKIEHNCEMHSRLSEAIALEARELFHQANEELPLSSVARFVNGKAFTQSASGEGRPILRIKELNTGISDGTLWAEIDASDDNVARHHDLLFAWSGSLGVYRWDGPESLINQHIFKVIPNDPYPLWLVEAWTRLHLGRFRTTAQDKAVTMGHIRREDLDEALVPVPNSGALSSARDRVGAYDDLRSSLSIESGRLAQIRGTLLPKLVSGELCVADSFDSEEILGPALENAVVAA